MCLMIKTFTLNRNKNINNNNNIENQLAKFLPKCKMARIEKIFSISFCFIDFPFSNKEIHDRKIHIWLIRFALVFFEQQQRRRWWWFSIFIKKNYKSNHDEPWWMMMMMMTNLFFIYTDQWIFWWNTCMGVIWWFWLTDVRIAVVFRRPHIPNNGGGGDGVLPCLYVQCDDFILCAIYRLARENVECWRR